MIWRPSREGNSGYRLGCWTCSSLLLWKTVWTVYWL